MPWQPVGVRYPDTEAATAALLRDLLADHPEADGVWVGRKLPKNRPPRAVQIIRDGGAQRELRDRAVLRVLVWDRTDEEVADLAGLVCALVPLMVGRSGVLYVKHLSGPYEVPDAAPKRYLLFEIHFRGEPL